MKQGLRIAAWSPGFGGLGGGVKYAMLLLKPLLGSHDVTVFHTSCREPARDLLRKTYGFELPGVRFRPLDHPESLRRLTRGFDVFLNLGYGSFVSSSARRNLLLVCFPVPLDDHDRVVPPMTRLAHARQRMQTRLLEWADVLSPSLEQQSFAQFRARKGAGSAFVCLPGFVLRKLGWFGASSYRLGYPALNHYATVIAISRYTAHWTERYYGKASELLYPPIDVDRFVPGAKENLILSVGRFEPAVMSKRHDALLEVFQELRAEGAMSDWKMVIAGGSDGSPAFESTIESLKTAGSGSPVSVEVNIPFERMQHLYGAASVYVHAMGLDQDPQKTPWAFEHFGMTTVEAMAAGAIPFVIAGGGQPEIVMDGHNGFLWRTREELKCKLRYFLNLGRPEISALRQRARERSQEFSEAAFYVRACEIYRKLGLDCEVG